MEVLRNAVDVEQGGEEGVLPGSSCVQTAHRILSEREDKQFGGFGSAPKFPQPGKLLCVYMTLYMYMYMYIVVFAER